MLPASASTFNAPVAVTLPSTMALASFRLTTKPTALTAPAKSLPICARVITPLPASTVVTPVAINAPTVWLIALFVLPSVSVLPAVTLWPTFNPLLPNKLTVPPLSAPAVLRLPPWLCRSIAPVPVLIADAGNVSVVPAFAVNAVLTPNVSAARVKALVSRMLTLTPVLLSVTAPVKSLPALAKVIALAPAVMLVAPPTFRTPVCMTAPPLLMARPPPVSVMAALN